MYLSDIEIFGFKSFYKKTHIKFAEGITALVGPNGCGKSNIVDAIRWVLGEQKTSVLRSDNMANVIFNGTATRSALSMAEVKMTIENNKNILPSEYSEITITRRILRSGESHYFLNNTRCRLKDIHDLFMDTGMGADSYSVIEHKMVEAILNGKPEERRHLIEEAAGITKYKDRRKEATRNLVRVKDDLSRARDILTEIQKNVNSLSRQAAKTRRYNQLQTDLREIELTIFYVEYGLYTENLLGKQKQKSEFEEQMAALNNEIEIIQEKAKVVKAEITQLEEGLSEKHLQYKDIESNFNTKNKDKAVSAEKLQSLKSTQKRVKDEIENFDNTKQNLEKELDSLSQKLAEMQAHLSNLSFSIESKQEEIIAARNSVDSVKDTLAQLRSKLAGIENKIQSHQSIIERNRNKIAGIENSIKLEEAKTIQTNSELAQIEETLAGILAKEASISSELQEAERNLNLATEQKSALTHQIDEEKRNLNEQLNTLSQKKSSLTFLQNIRESNSNSKYLLENATWSKAKPEILAESIGVDDNARIAIESLLGEFSHTIICKSKEEANAAGELLKQFDKGKANFVIKDEVPKLDAPEKISSDKVIGWASEITRVDDQTRYFLRHLFGRTLLVEDLENAENILKEFKAEKLISFSGEIYSNYGYAKSGSVTKNEGIQIGKNERIAKLNAEIITINEQIEITKAKLQELNNEFSDIDLNALSRAVKVAEEQINQNKYKHSQLLLKKESLEQANEMIATAIANKQTEIEEVRFEIANLNNEIEQFNSETAAIRKEIDSISEQLTETTDNFNSVTGEFRESELEYTKLKTEIAQTEREIKRIEQTIEHEITRNEVRHNELSNTKVLIETIEAKLIEFDKEIEDLAKEMEGFGGEIKIAEVNRKEHEKELDVVNSELNEKRKVLDNIKEQLHKIDIGVAHLESEQEHIVAKAAENYNLEIKTLEIEVAEDFNIKGSKILANDYKDKLNSLGSVNFLALEEFEQESQRLELFEKQVNDLEFAEKNLAQTIDEINQTAEKNFKETFEKIRENYKFLFQKLFNSEGMADLELENDNVLEANIKILAQPPGKKPVSIEMLSSGEKTLTALALLFAIYMVKPSPFCILDEVDAPFDDANVDKFINILRDFCVNTQFIVVTHNKKTMTSADYLYGVTQQEKGLSQIASVRMN